MRAICLSPLAQIVEAESGNRHGNAPKSWESKFPELTNHAMFIIRLAHNSLATVTQESHQTSLTIKSLVNLKSVLRWMAGRPGKTSF